jgi:hypothetical protein
LRGKIDNLLSCGCSVGGETKVSEGCPHVGAEGLVVPVNPGAGGGWSFGTGFADAGEDRREDVVAEHGQVGDGVRAAWCGTW